MDDMDDMDDLDDMDDMDRCISERLEPTRMVDKKLSGDQPSATQAAVGGARG